jgi:Tfp pilus assembly protein PilP
MKLMTAILAVGMIAGTLWAQSPAATPKTNATPSAAAAQKKPVSVHAAASNAQAPAKSATSAKPSAVSVKPAVSVGKPAASVPARAAAGTAKPAAVAAKPAVKAAPAPKVVSAAKPVAKAKVSVKAIKPKAAASQPKQETVSVENQKPAEPAKNEKSKTISASGRRDPFVSPVVNTSAVGSGCSTGKRCLAVGQISLKGVVKSETGMIAVVVNALDKAYFLRENDPVFDGYVLKITGDSIVFKETVQDKLGKPFTREVTKKITTPVV